MRRVEFKKIYEKKSLMVAIYAMEFFLSLLVAVNIYINSSFLLTFTTEDFVGIIYSVGSFLTILSVLLATKVLEKYGNYKTILILFVLNTISLVGLAIFKSFSFVIFAFFIHFILSVILFFNLDAFIENYSQNEKTGAIRGTTLTVCNIAFIIGPIIAGFLSVGGAFWKIYIVAAILNLPILLLLILNFKNFKDPQYNKLKFWETAKKVAKNKDVRGIFVADFVLRSFFAWMVIYSVIYLNKYIGFGFDSIGIIMSVMLFAYLFLELPLGILADKKFGEKEILNIGFVILIISTAALSFITGKNLIVWAGAFFATRVGAAMVEIMTETYFFKKIDRTDTNVLSLFRMMRPFAYMLAPIIATVFLIFFDIKYIFIAIAAITLIGLKYGLSIKDTQ